MKRSGLMRWVLRSMLANTAGTAVDYALVTTATLVLGVRTVVAAALGTTTGAALNFWLNRRYAFGQQASPVGPQLVRYVVAIGSLLAVHAVTLATLRDRLGVPLLIAKIGCDLTLLFGGQLLLLRFVVFRGSPPPSPET